MKKRKKIIACVAAALILGAWTLRYYSLNDGFAVKYAYPREFYNLGEKVDYGQDRPDFKTSCEGYSIKVNGIKFYDLEEYTEMYPDGVVTGRYGTPDKVAELDITLYNKDNTEDGITFQQMHIVGRDWVATYHRELVAMANPVFENDAKSAFGVKLLTGADYDIKLAYGLFKQNFPEDRWNNIENEELSLMITCVPTEKHIKLS